MVNNLVIADLLYGVYWLVKRHRKNKKLSWVAIGAARRPEIAPMAWMRRRQKLAKAPKSVKAPVNVTIRKKVS
jgi:hypothetical protein